MEVLAVREHTLVASDDTIHKTFIGTEDGVLFQKYSKRKLLSWANPIKKIFLNKKIRLVVVAHTYNPSTLVDQGGRIT